MIYRLKTLPAKIRFLLREKGVRGLCAAIVRKVGRTVLIRFRKAQTYFKFNTLSYGKDVGRGRSGLKIAMLTYRMAKGYGVDIVVAEHIEYFIGRAYSVHLLLFEQDDYYEHLKGYTRNAMLKIHRISSVEEARRLIQHLNVDIAIAHTPPMYSILPRLPGGICKVFHDYGEPPAELFSDCEERKMIHAEKVKAAGQCDLRISISEYIRTDSGIKNVIANWLGNDHLQKRRNDLQKLSGGFRAMAKLKDEFIVCNVTRYFEAERNYKGIDIYVRVKDALYAKHPELREVVKFVLIGRSNPEDREWARSEGLLAFSNFSEDEMIAVYTDSNFYLSGSQWEGYNLGIGQALSFGLGAAATDRGAHSEFGFPVSNDPEQLAEYIYKSYCEQSDPKHPKRVWRDLYKQSRIYSWKDSLVRFETLFLDAMLKGSAASKLFQRRSRIAGAKQKEVRKLRKIPSDPPEFSFLILNKDKPEMLIPCIRSIEKHCNASYEILIGDTGSRDEIVWCFYQNTPHQVYHLGFYNFSAGNNILAQKASGRYLVLLNNDVEIIKSDFRSVLEYAQSQKNTGTIGAYLIYPDRRIQHAGVRICPEQPYRGIPEHFDKFQSIDAYPHRHEIRPVVSVTGAFLIIHSERYEELGGLDEIYKEEAQDVDLCLKIHRLGLDNVIHPQLLAFHHEGSSRVEKESTHDRDIFLKRYNNEFENEIYAWQAERGL